MQTRHLTETLLVSSQLAVADVAAAAAQGVRSIINNRPDGESPDQPSSAEIEAAATAMGLGYRHIPIVPGQVRDEDVTSFDTALAELEAPVLAFCRTGTRSTTLWALGQAGSQAADAIAARAEAAGYDLKSLRPRLEQRAEKRRQAPVGERVDVVIIGGGSAGLATAASLRRRAPDLNIVVIEPRTDHFYQPGWTMVGRGVFDRGATCRLEASVIPKGVRWIKAAVASFEPEHDQVTLEDGSAIGYRALVVAPGIALDWAAIDGLVETLGKNGVTSNYSYETAPYTWELVQSLREGVALFTQPPMPIKCAGAPQKAMYLSCDFWRRTGRLANIEVSFHNAEAVLFGVNEYVPPLMRYVESYGIHLAFDSRLIAVDGPTRRATFKTKDGEVTKSFNMLHVCPPHKAPEFVAKSPLADQAGYVEVDPATLRHVRHPNVFGLGDGGSTPNSKTMAAARKQAPIVAENLLAMFAGREPNAVYDGYGSCPLTVERGKIVLAEFGYGGKLLPSFPKWLINGTKPQRLSWLLKSEVLPWVYWHGMLKGREYLARPRHRDTTAA
jgi:sulfide:quinone oxidoreductase